MQHLQRQLKKTWRKYTRSFRLAWSSDPSSKIRQNLLSAHRGDQRLKTKWNGGRPGTEPGKEQTEERRGDLPESLGNKWERGREQERGGDKHPGQPGGSQEIDGYAMIAGQERRDGVVDTD